VILLNQINQNNRFLNIIKNYPVTSTILILNILMFFLTLITGGFTTQNLVQLGGLVPYLVVNQGEYWRILTAMFLHGSFLHILSNMFALYILGFPLEKIMGKFRFTLLYIISGIGSGIAVVIFSNSLTLVIGASGAIYGIVGSLLFITFARPNWFTPQSVRSIRLMILINLIFTFVISNISIAGHIGGLVLGLLLSLILIPKKPDFTRFIRQYDHGYETVNSGDDYTVS